ncbi:hypothetical protein PII47_11725 [Pseudomonas sp. 21TX0197]|uniref:hypothetical protein n=1 Tax=unclassified Pseudomonas TaxID=196821 RepID=UPI0023308C33|nr:hypothetical protein [Pseudomonas sp. 21TX0197]MDB6444057.1 hypothetical protein [Pseudomonas sp. 21TX0197]
MAPDAILKCLTDSMGSDAWTRVLAQRFSSPAECVAEIFNPHRPGGAYACTRRDGVASGWAVYFRFHERAGYDGSMKLVLHSEDEDASSNVFDVLSSACASRGKEQGVHTLISVVDSHMQRHASWFSDSPFLLGGAVGASGNSTLNVFYRKLSDDSAGHSR